MFVCIRFRLSLRECIPLSTCGGQRTTWISQLSATTLVVLGIQMTSLAWVASAFG